MNTKPLAAGGSAALLALLILLVAPSARAQEARLRLDRLDRLAAIAIESVEITMNDAHTQFLKRLVSLSEPDRSKLKESLSGLKGVYVRGYEFARDGEYSDADLDDIRAQLRSPGWRRIVEVRNRNRGDEVFFMPRDNKMAGYAAISTEPRKICVINIVGPIDIDQLALLEREFHLTRCGGSNIGRQRRYVR